MSASQVKGAMILSIPQLGFPIIWAQTPTGFLVIIGVPALLLLVLQIKSIVEGIQEEIARKAQQLATQSTQKTKQGAI